MESQAIPADAPYGTEVPLGVGLAKIRNPIHVLLLDLVTLGIYGVVWYFKINSELARLGRIRHTTELGENPRNSLLALFPGMLIIVPAVVSMLNTIKRLRVAQTLTNIPEAEHVDSLPAFVLLFFVPPIGSWYFQKRLNNVWRAQATGNSSANSSL
jgi:uncharacterized protein DUF4234